MKDKRAQGLSLSTIVIAAIALIVLIVLIAIFTGRLSLFGKNYDQTAETTANKVCNSVGTCQKVCPQGSTQVSPPQGTEWIDCGSNQVCCTG